jgi:hypothetical protein
MRSPSLSTQLVPRADVPHPRRLVTVRLPLWTVNSIRFTRRVARKRIERACWAIEPAAVTAGVRGCEVDALTRGAALAYVGERIDRQIERVSADPPR